jgi:hypothetical protein
MPPKKRDAKGGEPVIDLTQSSDEEETHIPETPESQQGKQGQQGQQQQQAGVGGSSQVAVKIEFEPMPEDPEALKTWPYCKGVFGKDDCLWKQQTEGFQRWKAVTGGRCFRCYLQWQKFRLQKKADKMYSLGNLAGKPPPAMSALQFSGQPPGQPPIPRTLYVTNMFKKVMREHHKRKAERQALWGDPKQGKWHLKQAQADQRQTEAKQNRGERAKKRAESQITEAPSSIAADDDVDATQVYDPKGKEAKDPKGKEPKDPQDPKGKEPKDPKGKRTLADVRRKQLSKQDKEKLRKRSEQKKAVAMILSAMGGFENSGEGPSGRSKQVSKQASKPASKPASKADSKAASKPASAQPASPGENSYVDAEAEEDGENTGRRSPEFINLGAGGKRTGNRSISITAEITAQIASGGAATFDDYGNVLTHGILHYNPYNGSPHKRGVPFDHQTDMNDQEKAVALLKRSRTQAIEKRDKRKAENENAAEKDPQEAEEAEEPEEGGARRPRRPRHPPPSPEY